MAGKTWTFQYLLSVLSFFLALVLIARLLRDTRSDRRAPGSTVAWLLLMVLIPQLGVPLFLILGSRKLTRLRKRKKNLYDSFDPGSLSKSILPTERLLLASGVPPQSNGNHVKILSTGQDAFETLLQTLRSARRQIHISTYLLKLDPVGKRIVEILEERARSGVKVRLLLDGFGSFWTFRFRLRRFKKAGGQLAYFSPLIPIPFFGHANLRNHRKLVVVDDTSAVIGGMNLAYEYMGTDQNIDRWTDLSLLLQGPSVSDLSSIFEADWRFSSGEIISKSPPGRSSSNGTQTLQVVASGPDVSGDPLYDSLVSAIFDAKERVWIATPYFIPDETLSKSLELAAKRGVDVRLLIPKKSNHFLADLCRGGYLRQLERAGGKLYYYTGADGNARESTMMHAKALVVDSLYAVVGSANLDMRSLLLNFEVGLFIYSLEGIQAISHWYETLLMRSIQEPIKDRFGSDTIDGIGRILGPVL